MAEFCYECYKVKLKGKRKEWELFISEEDDLCEGCGKSRPVIDGVRPWWSALLKKRECK